MADDFPIVAGYLMPHPPVIVPGVSREPIKAEATVVAMQRLGADFARLQPETVVIISPHAPLFSDYVFFYDNPELTGSMARFGAPHSRLSFKQDDQLLHGIISSVKAAGISGGTLSAEEKRQHQIDSEMDHAVFVPLWFLHEQFPSFRVVAMSCSGLPLAKVYRVGELIRQAAERLGRRVVIVASGDQSHKVNDESPYGSVPEGAKFDDELTDCLRAGDLSRLLGIDGQLRERSAECGYRSLVMLCGAFNHQAVETRLESYEAPYGIGYCVAVIQPDLKFPEPVANAMQEGLMIQREQAARHQSMSQPPVRIARATLEAYVREGKHLIAADFRAEPEVAHLFKAKAGVFVSLKKFGDLRGCIGTTSPTTTNLVDEIIQNAISAGCRDPRFAPVEADELDDLTYSVDVLGAAEPITDHSQLDPLVYGVIVRSGGRSGLLLPDLEGVDTVDEQLTIACRKAGIRADEDFKIQRFKVTRYI